jgi:hypothetical protein
MEFSDTMPHARSIPKTGPAFTVGSQAYTLDLEED